MFFKFYQFSVNPAGGAGQASGGRKGKKKQTLDGQAGGVILHKADHKANVDVCQAALQCLTVLFLYCGHRMKPAAHKVGKLSESIKWICKWND